MLVALPLQVVTTKTYFIYNEIFPGDKSPPHPGERQATLGDNNLREQQKGAHSYQERDRAQIYTLNQHKGNLAGLDF